MSQMEGKCLEEGEEGKDDGRVLSDFFKRVNRIKRCVSFLSNFHFIIM